MFKRFLVTAALMGSLLATPATAALAAAPNGGVEFGTNVGQMAPDCATQHGVMFGEGVSAMAQGEPCPHDTVMN